MSSEWVQAEVHWALEKRKGRVIPIMIQDRDPADLHLKLRRIQDIDFRTDPDTGAAQLLELVRGEPFEQAPAREPLESEDEKMVIAGTGKTQLRLTVVADPQSGSKLDLCVRRDCSIGREREADIRIVDNRVSRCHLKFFTDSSVCLNQLLITDLGTASGTFVNDCRVVAPKVISSRDIVGPSAARRHRPRSIRKA